VAIALRAQTERLCRPDVRRGSASPSGQRRNSGYARRSAFGLGRSPNERRSRRFYSYGTARQSLRLISGGHSPHRTASPLCHRVSASLCHRVSASLCHRVSASLCHRVSASLFHRVSASLFHRVPASLCHRVSASLCHRVSGSPRPHYRHGLRRQTDPPGLGRDTVEVEDE